MRTSHKRTHTQLPAWLSSGWFKLLVTGLFLGSLAFVLVVRSGRWTAQANELEAARTQLEQAKAKYLSNPNKENTAAHEQALKYYRAALLATPAAVPATPQGAPSGVTGPFVGGAVTPILTPRASDLSPGEPSPSAAKIIRKNKNESNELPFRNQVGGNTNTSDPVVQSSIPPGQALVTNPIANFDGPDMDAGSVIFGGRFAPNDPNADVGPNHVVVTTNAGMQIFDKAGAPLTPVFKMSQLLVGLPFAENDDGDPIVLYDPLADRWLITQFQINNVVNGSTRQHVAISRTGDPTGQYFAYDFPHVPGRFGDYPHLGVWPDGYYMTTNDFNLALTAFLGASFYSFERDKMLAGLPAQVIAFSTGPTDGGLLPTDIDGLNLPPAGTPNLFMEFFADEFGDTDSLRVFEFRANFATPAASTLTQYDHDPGTAGAQNIPLAAFDARQPSSRAVIDQPAPATAADSLDSIADRLMHRLAYRRLQNGDQSYVLNFTVNVSGVAPTNSATYQGGVRWTELRRNSDGSGGMSVNQQATYAPGAISGATGRNLWMAGIAQDGEGNIGLAASASSTTLIPTAIYTGRLATDPPNTLPQGEVDAMAAVTRGVQTGTGNRWGDYSSLSVDPADECTFWGAFEYADGPSSSFDWNTRVFSFKVNPACVPIAKATIQGQATNSSLGGAPIPDVSVTIPGGFFRSTNTGGNYAFTNGVLPGTYTVTCSKIGFSSASGSVTVVAGGTATFNCALQGIPVIGLSSSAITAEDCNVDGKADPGEVISVQVCLSNTGGANAGNLVATLAATGGVTNPSAPQSYGAVPAGGAAVCRTFSFRVNPAQICGANTVATFTLADGATNLGTLNITFTSGTQVVTFAENFDGVTAPALPSSWAATNATGAAPLWVTSTTSPNSAPNALFVDDPAALTDKIITSPAINIGSAAAQLSFRHTFSLESGFDGGVVEASIDGGAFNDVTSAGVGGTFVAGTQGYTGAISTSFSSAIGGRQAFTGANPGGFGTYVTTTVQFGAALQGKSVRFRWRMASDTTVSGTGWRVDNVQVFGDLSCCVKITPTAGLSDPLACTGPGNNVSGQAAVTNPTASALNGGVVTVALPAGLIGVNGCTATVGGNPVGTCAVTPTAITWTGSLPGNSTLIINYLVQVGDVPPATTLCVTVSGGFTGIGLTTVQACVTVNCQAPGPGGLIPTRTADGQAIPGSDQKAGSVLIYPVYTSGSDPIRENTRISLTNVNPQLPAFVHLYFIDGSTCSVADAFICLTANQTATFLASDLDPGTTGYIVAMAVNSDGCPINFNYLIGDEYAKFQSGHAGNLGADAIPAVAGGFTPCTGSTATIRFDGVSYAPLARTVALDNIPSRADGNDTLLILNRIGGDLLTRAGTLTNLFGLLYNDAETSLSFSLRPNVCQFRSTISNNFPRTTPRFEQFVPAGRSSWLKLYSTDDIALNGASFNFNANATASANAFNGGHNLHTMTTTTSASYTLPVLPVSCQ